ncbi:MAG: AAA family ATPase, partial [Gemmatimonadaceae bacterium]
MPRLLRVRGALGCSPDSMRALTRLTKTTPDDPPAGVMSLDMDSVAHSITMAIGDLLDALSSEAPLLLVIEDAHWLDELSLETLSELIATRAARPVCVILTTRDRARLDEKARFADHLTTLALRPLPAAVSEELVEVALRGTSGASDASLRDWMVSASAGNPLFLHSIAAHYRATGTPFAVPASLRDLIGRRLDVLSPRSAAVLHACVVLGKLCTTRRMVSCLELPHVELVMALEELDAASALVVDSERLVPAHPLIAELVVARTPESAMRVLHARVATVLGADEELRESPALLWDCAEHWIAAGEDKRALEVLRSCAEHALTIGRASAAAETLLRAAGLRLADEVRMEILREAVRAASHGAELELVAVAIRKLHSLGQLSAHDDIELAEILALGYLYWDPSELERRTLGCLNAAEATPEHRVRAGVMALKYADHLGRPDVA